MQERYHEYMTRKTKQDEKLRKMRAELFFWRAEIEEAKTAWCFMHCQQEIDSILDAMAALKKEMADD